MKKTPRNDDILEQRSQAHLTYQQIGAKHGICRERVRQIIEKLNPSLLGYDKGPVYCRHCRIELLDKELYGAKARLWHCRICRPLQIIKERSQKHLLDFREVLEKIDFFRAKGLCDAEIGRKIWPDLFHSPQKLYNADRKREEALLKIKIAVVKLKILENRHLNARG